MVLFLLIIVIALSLLYLYYSLNINRTLVWNNRTEIPGPKPIPIFGSILKIVPPIHDYYYRLSKQYGGIFSIYFGMRKTVVINSYEIAKRIMKSDDSTGRLTARYIAAIDKNRGLITLTGKHWLENRQFTLHAFRDIGFGKSRSEMIVELELEYVLKNLYQHTNQTVNFTDIINYATTNIITTFLFNKRYEINDPILQKAQKVMKFTHNADMTILIELMFPFLKHSWLYEKLLLLFSKKKVIFHDFYDEINAEITEHRNNSKEDSVSDDYVDNYLRYQLSLNKDQSSSSGYFSNWDLIMNCAHLYEAGYDTTSSTISWALFFVTFYDSMQDMIHKEIVEQISDQRKITMRDKKSLHYTQAFMDEVLRLASTVPFAIGHVSLNNMEVDENYFIPTDTLVVYNIYAINRDENVWENPDLFKPERFLDENGKYKPNESLIPFGVGKRRCLGESLARTEYFSFFVNIIHKFRVKLAEEIKPERYNEILKGDDGIIRICKYSNFIFENRN